jgi:hypothetical protein
MGCSPNGRLILISSNSSTLVGQRHGAVDLPQVRLILPPGQAKTALMTNFASTDRSRDV